MNGLGHLKEEQVAYFTQSELTYEYPTTFFSFKP